MLEELGRRSLLTLSGMVFVGTLAGEGNSAAPSPAALSAEEQANLATVRAFFAFFADPALDLDMLARRFFAPSCVVRWTQFMPAVTGPKAAAAQMKPLLVKGTVTKITHEEFFAKGPVVVMARSETLTVPGKVALELRAVTVHVLRDGQFVEYAEWLLDLPSG